MAEDTLTIILIFLVVTNTLLVINGFSTGQSVLTGTTNTGVGGMSIWGTTTYLWTMVDLILGGGIISLMASAGMPIEIQYLFGAPFLIMTMFALVNVGGKIIGGITKMIP